MVNERLYSLSGQTRLLSIARPLQLTIQIDKEMCAKALNA